MLCTLLVAALAGCEQKTIEQISWQLPLTTQPDPHGADATQAMPAWAGNQQGKAVLALLMKKTARIYEAGAGVGGRVSLHGVEVRVLGVAGGLRLQGGAYIDDPNVDNPAAFVEVAEQGKVLYRGWLYQQFPEMFGPDAPEWRLFLRGLQLARPIPQEQEQSARSSAG